MNLNLFKKKNKEPEYEIKKFISYLRHNMMDTEEWVVTYKDGRKIRFIVNSLYPLRSIHEEPLFNAYGQDIYNNFYKENNIPQN